MKQSSAVQQHQQMMMMVAAAGNPTNWWTTICPPPSTSHETLSANNLITATLSPSSPLPLPSWIDTTNSSTQDRHHLPESWSQLLSGGLMVGDEDKGNHQIMMKQESSAGSYVMSCYDANQDHVANNSDFSAVNQIAVGASSSDLELRHPPPPLPKDQSPESSSIKNGSSGGSGGGIVKKARVQVPSASSSTSTQFAAVKAVRKEKVGDRITTLHQIVSPFGKTDTASVLLEAIGYIRFLQTQIEALSLPYLGSGSSNLMPQHYQHSIVQGERNCVFPEHPGQLLNDGCRNRKAASDDQQECYTNKDLRSRGLCLVPVSCTMQVGNDNGADYWAPSLGGGFR